MFIIDVADTFAGLKSFASGVLGAPQTYTSQPIICPTA
jgi:hypothetical protein